MAMSATLYYLWKERNALVFFPPEP